MSGTVDLFVIGGGVNGAGIARDAAGRGLSVTLAEAGDLAGATSSASSKLIHGGLRYLETYEFRLVREALGERAKLLRAMPHIAWPMRFVLPHHAGLRPRWMLRAGLFLYDHLAPRGGLPASHAVDLTRDPAGRLLKPQFRRGFVYSDGWVDDARLVALNARDAAERGATILTRTRVTGAVRRSMHWEITVERDGQPETHTAWRLVNAAGPWVDVVADTVGAHSPIRLVRGSHIVVKRLPGHEQPYILQGGDGRIVFLIPWEDEFTLIGTTDVDHQGDPRKVECTDEEVQYLVDFVNEYLAAPIALDDVVWRYAGVRPLLDSGGAASKASRDYHLELDDAGAPLLTVLGGKITTYRHLAEAAMARLKIPGPWTAGVPLPGGDFAREAAPALVAELIRAHPFLTEPWARRLVRSYGTEARAILGEAQGAAELGRDFGATLSEAEVRFLQAHEFARTADDILWRRTKLGLRMREEQRQALADWLSETA